MRNLIVDMCAIMRNTNLNNNGGRQMTNQEILEQLRTVAIATLKAYYSQKYLCEMDHAMPGLSEQDAKMAVHLADKSVERFVAEIKPMKEVCNDWVIKNGLQSFTMQERA